MANEEWDHLAVDWPKTQVKRIDSTMEDLAAQLVHAEQRIADLERRLRAQRRLTEQGADKRFNLESRIAKLEHRLERGDDPDDETEPFEVWTDRQLSKMGVALTEIHQILRQLSSKTDRLELFDKQTDEAYERLQNQFGERLVEVEGALRDYGIPLVTGKTAQFAELYGMTPTGRVTIPGPGVTVEMNVASILDEAAVRVTGYMAQHFSEATIRGVVRAVKGLRSEIGDPPLGEEQSRAWSGPPRELITDHSFRSASPDRRHCSYVRNREENRCGRSRAEHAIKANDPIVVKGLQNS